MSTLPKALREYVALRCALGAQFTTDEANLWRFVEFAGHEGADVITIDLVLRWATAPGRASTRTRAMCLGVVRRFAAWLSATDPRTEVPPKDLLPSRLVRKPPYIYTDEEIARIVKAASRLASPTGLRGLTFATLFGLLAVTGLRLSEALGLDLDAAREEIGVNNERLGTVLRRVAANVAAQTLPLGVSTTPSLWRIPCSCQSSGRLRRRP